MKKFILVISILFSVISNWSQFNSSNQSIDTLANNEAENINIDETVFKNLKAHSKPEALKITWSIDYKALDHIKGKKLIIKYNTKIGAKRYKKKYEGSEWKYSEAIDINETSYEIKDLHGSEKYELYLGLISADDLENINDDTKIIWSDKVKAKTERGWGIMKFLILIGSLGLFIFGMKIMSDGMQRTAGEKLRKMLGSITSNRLKGILTGFSSTSIVQSSSVTTVMTVSLVNAGLLNLRQSAGVMMGANIGTTITAWLVLMLGFKVSISSYALVLIAIGAPLLFMSFRRSKDIADAIIGFAILFIGLQFLKDAVPDLDKDSAFVQFFVNYKDIPFISNLMFVALGTLVTIVIQSSSAAMAITMTMVAKGIIPFEVACAMVLGENIGTTITAYLASLGGNYRAKQTARAHMIFNCFGVIWMLIAFRWFIPFIDYLVPGDSYLAKNIPVHLSMFHTLFNITNVLLLLLRINLIITT